MKKYGKSKRYNKRKRRGYKKYSKNARSISRIPTILPDKYLCKLKYVCEFQLDPEGSVGAVSKVFRANDLYDPEYAVGGHQPMGFDQLATMFHEFCVLGSKIQMYPMVVSTTAVTPQVYGITLNKTGTYMSGKTLPQIFEEERTSKPAPIAMNQQVGSTTKFSGVRSKTFSIKKFLGRKRDQDDVCSNSASPTTPAYFECWACGVNDINTGAIWYMVKINYIVLCTSPALLGQS